MERNVYVGDEAKDSTVILKRMSYFRTNICFLINLMKRYLVLSENVRFNEQSYSGDVIFNPKHTQMTSMFPE